MITVHQIAVVRRAKGKLTRILRKVYCKYSRTCKWCLYMKQYKVLRELKELNELPWYCVYNQAALYYLKLVCVFIHYVEYCQNRAINIQQTEIHISLLLIWLLWREWLNLYLCKKCGMSVVGDEVNVMKANIAETNNQ